MTVFDDNPKNLYVIKHRLSDLRKSPSGNCFYYEVGNFVVKIFTSRIQDVKPMAIYKDYTKEDAEERVTHYETVDVCLYEWVRQAHSDSQYESMINMDVDERFSSYAPIQHVFPYRHGTGVEMPIINLCELIKYLHRLSNLSAFA